MAKTTQPKTHNNPKSWGNQQQFLSCVRKRMQSSWRWIHMPRPATWRNLHSSKSGKEYWTSRNMHAWGLSDRMRKKPKPGHEKKTSRSQNHEWELHKAKSWGSDRSLHSLHECQNEKWGSSPLPSHVRVNEIPSGVCMWERTNSPTTHHYPCNNCPN